MLCSVVVGFLCGLAAIVFMLCVTFVEGRVKDVYSMAGINWVLLPKKQPAQSSTKSPAEKEDSRNSEPVPSPSKTAEEFPPLLKSDEKTEFENDSPYHHFSEPWRSYDYYREDRLEEPHDPHRDFFGTERSSVYPETVTKKQDAPRAAEVSEPAEPTDEVRIRAPFLVPDSRTDEVFGTFRFPRYWAIIVLVPAIGGLICGLLVWTLAPEASGEGVETLIKSYHKRNGMIRFRSVPVKTAASVATIGSGGSAGWEGPITLIGGGIGSFLARYFKLDARERRILLLAGAAAGFGAIFQSPFAGALFVAEILYCSTAIELPVLLPCIIASLIGYGTCAELTDHSRSILVPASLEFFHISWILWFVPFALFCIPFGLLFVKLVHEMRNRFFSRMEIPELFKPALGGFALGCVALFLPHVRGGGYEYYQAMFDGSFSLKLMLLLVLGKMLATAFTVASGGSGGLIAPSIFIGGMLGGVYGLCVQGCCQSLGIAAIAPEPGVFVIIGMGAFLAGIGKIPLTASVLVCSLIGSYAPLLPLLLVAFVQLAIYSPRTTLFREQLPSFEDSPVHLGDFSTDLLEGIRVKDVKNQTRKPQEIASETPLSKLMELLADSSASVFPVLDDKGTLIGMLFAGDIRSTFHSHGPRKKLVAADLALHKELVLTLEDTLLAALRMMVRFSVDEIPVVAAEERNRVLFLLRKDDVHQTYHDRLAGIRTLED